MCHSFILRSLSDQSIDPGQTKMIATNFAFSKMKERRKAVKSVKRMREEDDLKQKETSMKYHTLSGLAISNQCIVNYVSGHFIDISDKICSVSVTNLGADKCMIPEDAQLCKIFFYFEK